MHYKTSDKIVVTTRENTNCAAVPDINIILTMGAWEVGGLASENMSV